jgi:hypothetical protein
MTLVSELLEYKRIFESAPALFLLLDKNPELPFSTQAIPISERHGSNAKQSWVAPSSMSFRTIPMRRALVLVARFNQIERI